MKVKELKEIIKNIDDDFEVLINDCVNENIKASVSNKCFILKDTALEDEFEENFSTIDETMLEYIEEDFENDIMDEI